MLRHKHYLILAAIALMAVSHPSYAMKRQPSAKGRGVRNQIVAKMVGNFLNVLNRKKDSRVHCTDQDDEVIKPRKMEPEYLRSRPTLVHEDGSRPQSSATIAELYAAPKNSHFSPPPHLDPESKEYEEWSMNELERKGFIRTIAVYPPGYHLRQNAHSNDADSK